MNFLEQGLLPIWHRDLATHVDRLSSSECGVSELILMEAAAKAIVDEVALWIEEHRENAVPHIIFLVGGGNNGGDALAAARIMKERFGASEATFEVILVDDPITTPCKHQLQRCQTLGIATKLWSKDLTANRDHQAKSVLIVDGIFGLGFKGILREGKAKEVLAEFAMLVKTNEWHVLAIDLPSGMDADEGTPIAFAELIKADITVTFGVKKPVHALAPARDYCGKIVVADIGFPPAAVAKASMECPLFFCEVDRGYFLRDQAHESTLSGSVKSSANKFDRGHVLVIGGSPGKLGAPILAGMAAMRGGAGWVSLATPEAPRFQLKWEASESELEAASPLELVWENLWTKTGTLDAAVIEKFINTRKVRSIVFGPGFTRQHINTDVNDIFARFTQNQNGFIVFDGGGLHDITRFLGQAAYHATRVLCTPHPGEWQKLGCGILAEPTHPNRLIKAASILKSFPATFVFKGATPVILSPMSIDQPGWIITAGTNVLARAGTGDVVAGVAAAQGVHLSEASKAFAKAMIIVANAGKLAAASVGGQSVVATDLIQKIGLAMM